MQLKKTLWHCDVHTPFSFFFLPTSLLPSPFFDPFSLSLPSLRPSSFSDKKVYILGYVITYTMFSMINTVTMGTLRGMRGGVTTVTLILLMVMLNEEALRDTMSGTGEVNLQKVGM